MIQKLLPQPHLAASIEGVLKELDGHMMGLIQVARLLGKYYEVCYDFLGLPNFETERLVEQKPSIKIGDWSHLPGIPQVL